jgi:hypothetical protein
MALCFVNRRIGSTPNKAVRLLSHRIFAMFSRSPFSCTVRLLGILHVPPQLRDRIKKDDIIAVVSDVYGFVTAKFLATEPGIIIGKSSNPSNHQGQRCKFTFSRQKCDIHRQMRRVSLKRALE